MFCLNLGRREALCKDREGLLFAISGVAETGKDVLGGKVREVCEDFGLAHAGSEIRENVVDSDAHTSDAGFAAAFAGFEGDGVLVVHGMGLSWDES